MYESRVADLEADLASRENQYRQAMAAKDGEIKELRQQMADQLMEYHELMDIKLALDMEIGTRPEMWVHVIGLVSSSCHSPGLKFMSFICAITY